MDFFQIKERNRPKPGRPKNEPDTGQDSSGLVELYPDFKVCRSKDLMVRGRSFYAVWDESKGMWSTDEYDVQRLVDEELYAYQEKLKSIGVSATVKSMGSFSTKSWIEFRNYLGHISDSNVQLDEKLTFSNTVVKKKDYVSKRLSYPLEEGSFAAYDEIIGTLYEPDERAKLEWAIGSVIAGDSRDIQKFIVLYGEAGSGKSTILNIIQKLFEGYYTTFEAKALVGANNSFATEVFRENPLVAIQHDGDLSKIEDNSKLNSIISHEEMTVNEKHKPQYTSRINAFLFMATNKPVKITDAKSGIIRRLIDVSPSGRKFSSKKYFALMAQVDFELGAIANHCLEVYKSMGKNYYSQYRPIGMMFQTDPFFNFIEANFDLFREEDGVSLNRAYDIYKKYCEEALVDFKLPRHKFREELKSYFSTFSDVSRVDGKQVRSYYSGFKTKMFSLEQKEPDKTTAWLSMDCTESLFDEVCKDCKAQYASDQEIPSKKWADVNTKLSDLDTGRLHYVQLPLNHIVVDFDLRDANGNKSPELNLAATEKWTPTYAEYSKSGGGIHLHYFYDGDPDRISRVYSDGIEVKVSVGGSSLRRRLSKCNDLPIATINSGLPLRGEKVIKIESVKSEIALRKLIQQNLDKEIHPGTKPSMDFICKILDDAYESGLKYDVSDMRQKILIFAANSTHQADYCVKLVGKLKFKSEDPNPPSEEKAKIDDLVFFDVEVFPNLFIVVWKIAGPEHKCVRMINPTPADIEDLMKFKLVGFNCLRYDNSILYGRYIGYTNQQLYNLSQRIINGERTSLFREATDISYTDVYDFASAEHKQSLKKFEIDLGIHHMELGLPWNKPVPEDMWLKVAEYCDNDVLATEAVFYHLRGDWVARQILSEISGLTVNDTTNHHSTKIIFGDNKKPQDQLVYTDLSEMFPGYKFEAGKSLYRGEDPKEGGYVYTEPGIYRNVALLDVASMHPTSIEQLNLFGPYTKIYSDIKQARLGIKHKDREALEKLLDGKLVPFFDRAMNGEFSLKDLSTALKTALNSAYGLTSASFVNAFRDPRNVDNIVAKRGALFMIDLKHAVQDFGFKVAHIKTDSIKIPNATPDVIKFVMDFGKRYGYVFEHEATYDRMCLVNKAVYIAKYMTSTRAEALYGYIPDKCREEGDKWTATGAEFDHPYIFKTLFSKEPIVFKDMCEVKSVTSAMYLDMNENLPDVSRYETELEKIEKQIKKLLKKADEAIGEDKNLILDECHELDIRADEIKATICEGHDYHFVGKTSSFCPISPGLGGGVLVREKDGKYYAVSNTTNYRWLESEAVTILGKEDSIDMRYYRGLVDAAIGHISEFGDFEMFVSDEESPPFDPNVQESTLPCGKKGDYCFLCENFVGGKTAKACKLGYRVVPF
jgi:energy-coupling factor transporter ATP-binding protein EcfA2